MICNILSLPSLDFFISNFLPQGEGKGKFEPPPYEAWFPTAWATLWGPNNYGKAAFPSKNDMQKLYQSISKSDIV